jgi:hypothetical protein
MPVTATSDPDVVKVSFQTSLSALSQIETIVYARAMDDGLVDLYYSHQVFRERNTEEAPWDPRETIQRTPLNRALSEQVRVGAMMELFNQFFGGLQVLSVPPGSDPVAFQWSKSRIKLDRPS